MKYLLAAMLVLGGCSGSFFESKIPIAQIYVLQATTASEPGNQIDADVAIGRPTAAPGLETERIAVLRNSRELDYYANAIWGDTAPRTLQYFLASSLQHSSRFRSVTSEQTRVTTNYIIELELQDFQAEYMGASQMPSAHVGVAVALLRIKDRKLVDRWLASATIPATENRLSAVIAAFESASQQVATQIATRAADAIANPPG